MGRAIGFIGVCLLVLACGCGPADGSSSPASNPPSSTGPASPTTTVRARTLSIRVFPTTESQVLSFGDSTIRDAQFKRENSDVTVYDSSGKIVGVADAEYDGVSSSAEVSLESDSDFWRIEINGKRAATVQGDASRPAITLYYDPKSGTYSESDS